MENLLRKKFWDQKFLIKKILESKISDQKRFEFQKLMPENIKNGNILEKKIMGLLKISDRKNSRSKNF